MPVDKETTVKVYPWGFRGNVEMVPATDDRARLGLDPARYQKGILIRRMTLHPDALSPVKKTGTIRVSSCVSGGTLKIDGKPLGEPPVDVEVMEGKHTVSLYVHGKIPEHQSVTVEAGQVSTVQFCIQDRLPTTPRPPVVNPSPRPGFLPLFETR